MESSMIAFMNMKLINTTENMVIFSEMQISTGMIIGAVVILLLVIVIMFYNKLVKLRNRVRNQESQISIQLKRRAELIPNLVATVKEYTGHEKTTYTEVARLRNSVLAARTTEEALAANAKLNHALPNINVLIEQYPELKANTSFLNLQEELAGTEDKISKARQFFNDTAMKYNTEIEVFPNVIFANLLGFRKARFLEATAQERGPVSVRDAFRD